MADADVFQTRRTSFGEAAELYEQARPTYPSDAVDWLVAGAQRVADVGAGTGKLTRLLADRGLDVVAVEPSDGMRQQLQSVLPSVDALAGTAEDLPLADASVDAVVFAQAWHWVDVPRASAEAARVLRPGGHLGLVWNQRDDRADWLRSLDDDLSSVSRNVRRPHIGSPFTRFEHFEIEWSVPQTQQGLIDLVLSRSNLIIASAEKRAAVIEKIKRLTAEHPALAGRESFELPYVTYCTRAFVA